MTYMYVEWLIDWLSEDTSLMHRCSYPIFQNTFKLFGFPMFRYWAYLMKVIPEKRRVYQILYLRFYYSYVRDENKYTND